MDEELPINFSAHYSPPSVIALGGAAGACQLAAVVGLESVASRILLRRARLEVGAPAAVNDLPTARLAAKWSAPTRRCEQRAISRNRSLRSRHERAAEEGHHQLPASGQ